MRAVLDTNVVVSALLVAGSSPDRALRAGLAGAFQLVISPELVDELSKVLQRPHIAARVGWTAAESGNFLGALVASAMFVRPTRRLTVVRDDADNRVLEAALAGIADYIVSGDRALLELGDFEGVQVVAPARFAAILATEER